MLSGTFNLIGHTYNLQLTRCRILVQGFTTSGMPLLGEGSFQVGTGPISLPPFPSPLPA